MPSVLRRLCKGVHNFPNFAANQIERLSNAGRLDDFRVRTQSLDIADQERKVAVAHEGNALCNVLQEFAGFNRLAGAQDDQHRVHPWQHGH